MPRYRAELDRSRPQPLNATNIEFDADDDAAAWSVLDELRDQRGWTFGDMLVLTPIAAPKVTYVLRWDYGNPDQDSYARFETVDELLRELRLSLTATAGQEGYGRRNFRIEAPSSDTRSQRG